MARNLEQNILDRVIAAISPAWGFQRAKHRFLMSRAGGYSGARKSDRFAHWAAGTGDADADSIPDMLELRGRSRDQVRNNPIAASAIDTQVANVVGTGLSLEPCIDGKFLRMTDEAVEAWQEAAEREWCAWADTKACDYTQELNFYGLQDLAFRSMLESGDCFILNVRARRPGSPFRTALQLIEADRVSNPNRRQDTDLMTDGIERDENGMPIAVHISDKHPGRIVSGPAMKWTRVPIRGESGRVNVIHLMRKLRPGQSRGIPVLAPIIGHLKQLDRYTNAEIDAAVNSAAIAIFVKMDPDAFQDIYTDDSKNARLDAAKEWDGTLKSGAAMNLLPGESVESPNLGRPNPNFDPFMSSMLRQVGMGLGIPYEVLVKHFQSSYSAARAALLDAWRLWRIRRSFLADNLCQVVWSEFLGDQVSAGRISAPGFWSDPIYRAAWSRATWGGDGMGTINPETEATAAQLRVDMGLTTLPEEIMAYDGGDWSEKHRTQAKVQAARVADKLAPPVDQPKPGAAAPPAKPMRAAESLNSGEH